MYIYNLQFGIWVLLSMRDLLHPSSEDSYSTVKVKAAGSPETTAPLYQTTF
jgi:hypothetical protein